MTHHSLAAAAALQLAMSRVVWVRSGGVTTQFETNPEGELNIPRLAKKLLLDPDTVELNGVLEYTDWLHHKPGEQGRFGGHTGHSGQCDGAGCSRCVGVVCHVR